MTEIAQDAYDDPPPLSLNSTLFTIESSSSTQPQMVHLDVSRIRPNQAYTVSPPPPPMSNTSL